MSVEPRGRERVRQLESRFRRKRGFDAPMEKYHRSAAPFANRREARKLLEIVDGLFR
jgi:hypothetical protein